MRKRSIGLFAIAALLATIVFGCGGGDETTESTASLTKSAFIKQGNAICARTNKQFEDEFEDFSNEKTSLSTSGEPSRPQLIEAVEQLYIPIIGQQIEELRALGAPAGEEQEVDKAVSAGEEGLQEVREDPSSLLVSSGGPFGEYNKLMTDYGLAECGEE